MPLHRWAGHLRNSRRSSPPHWRNPHEAKATRPARLSHQSQSRLPTLSGAGGTPMQELPRPPKDALRTDATEAKGAAADEPVRDPRGAKLGCRYQRWSMKDLNTALKMRSRGICLKEIAEAIGRTLGGVAMMLNR